MSIPISRSVSPVDTTTVSPSTTRVTVTDLPAPGAVEVDDRASGAPESPPALEHAASATSAATSKGPIRPLMAPSLAATSASPRHIDPNRPKGKHLEMLSPTGWAVLAGLATITAIARLT